MLGIMVACGRSGYGSLLIQLTRRVTSICLLVVAGSSLWWFPVLTVGECRLGNVRLEANCSGKAGLPSSSFGSSRVDVLVRVETSLVALQYGFRRRSLARVVMIIYWLKEWAAAAHLAGPPPSWYFPTNPVRRSVGARCAHLLGPVLWLQAVRGRLLRSWL